MGGWCSDSCFVDYGDCTWMAILKKKWMHIGKEREAVLSIVIASDGGWNTGILYLDS